MSYHTTDPVSEGFELGLDHTLFEEFEFGSVTSSQTKNNENQSKSKSRRKDAANSSENENISPQLKDGNCHDVAPLREDDKRKKKRRSGIIVVDAPAKKTQKQKKNQFTELVHKLRDELPDGNKRLVWNEEEVAALIAGIHKHHNSSSSDSFNIGKIKLWRSIKDDPAFAHTLRLRTNVMLKDKYRTLYGNNPELFPASMRPPAKKRSTDGDDELPLQQLLPVASHKSNTVA